MLTLNLKRAKYRAITELFIICSKVFILATIVFVAGKLINYSKITSATDVFNLLKLMIS